VLVIKKYFTALYQNFVRFLLFVFNVLGPGSFLKSVGLVGFLSFC